MCSFGKTSRPALVLRWVLTLGWPCRTGKALLLMWGRATLRKCAALPAAGGRVQPLPRRWPTPVASSARKLSQRRHHRLRRWLRLLLRTASRALRAHRPVRPPRCSPFSLPAGRLTVVAREMRPGLGTALSPSCTDPIQVPPARPTSPRKLLPEPVEGPQPPTDAPAPAPATVKTEAAAAPAASAPAPAAAPAAAPAPMDVDGEAERAGAAGGSGL